MKECKYCKSEVKSKSNNAKFCSIECRDKNKFEEKQTELLKGVETQDYVIDKWNGYATTRIFGRWFKSMHPGRTTEEYRQEFPGAKLQCDKLNEKNGQYMKEDRYREAQRQRMLGDGNPNHTSKTTKEQRQAKSPFSKKFKGYNSEEDRRAFIDSVDYGSIKKSSDIEWWIEKCNGNIKKAKELYTERQTTFTLEKCIKKYGKKQGTKIFNDRQEKWLKSFPRTNYSKISQKLFIELYEAIKNDFNEIYFATLNNGSILHFNNGKNYEYTLKLKTSSIKPDFFIKDIGKIIEFDGVYWHRKNPENKKREEKRDREIKAIGYQVYHVNESDYNQSPEKTIQKCITFLKK
jgi:G:T-mismatch repair DNA endonuclease (very short patch repair protein)